MQSLVRAVAIAMLVVAGATGARAQLSLSSAVDLALKNDPRVKSAEANVKKAEAVLAETHDAFIPVITVDGGYGKSVDVPQGLPTIFSLSTQSVAFDIVQVQAIKVAQNALRAAKLDLEDVRSQVEEDAVITYLSLDAAQRRHAAIAEEFGYASRLEAIVNDRLGAGQDTQAELLRAKRNVVQIRLAERQAEDEIENLRDHLSRIVGLQGVPIATEGASIPKLDAPVVGDAGVTMSPAIASIFANAEAKNEQARGDSLSRFLPTLSLNGNFSKIDTSQSQSNFLDYYPGFVGKKQDAASIGLQARIPLFNKALMSRAHESRAEADHLRYEAQAQQNVFLDGRAKLRRSTEELSLRSELARLDLELAKNQIDTVMVQLSSSGSDPNAVLLTPKDEQNARLQERQRFVELLDAELELQKAEVQLLRQSGTLDAWARQP